MTDALGTPSRDAADAKAWFYLDHRREIEAWAALRADAAVLLDRCLLEIGPAVEQLAVELGASFEAFDPEVDSDPRFGIYKPEWTRGGQVEVSVVVEWQPRLLLVGRYNQWPWVAVRSNGGDEAKRQWNELVGDLAGARRTLRASASTPWPLWRYVEPLGEESGLDLDRYFEHILDELRRVWFASEGVVNAYWNRRTTSSATH